MKILASGQTIPNDVTADSSFAYWCTGDGFVKKVSINGGSITNLVSDGSLILFLAINNTTQADYVFYTDYANGDVKKVSTNGSGETTLSTGQTQPQFIVAGLTQVIFSCGDGTVKKVSQGGGSTTTLATIIGESYISLALDINTATVYMICYTTGTIKSVPLGGGSITTLTSGLNGAIGRAVDNTNIYWTNSNDGTINKISKGGGSTTVLATGQSTPEDVVTDGIYVYWSVPSYVSHTGGSVNKVKISGGPVQGLAFNLHGVNNVFINNNIVYAAIQNTSGADGIIVSVPGTSDFCTLNDTISAISNEGIVWTTGSLPSSHTWAETAFNGTIFCTVANNSSSAATSPDGITWTPQTLPVSTLWNSIVWNDSIFCAISQSGGVAATSPDGITWTQRALPSSGLWGGLCWNGEIFCIVKFGSSSAATSPDGITWTPQTLPVSGNWRRIAWNGTSFCAVTSTTIAATSPDGITWTQRALPAFANPIDIKWNGSIFCVIDNTDNKAYISSDGITWSMSTLPTGSSWQRLAWNGDVFCTVLSSSSSAATSPDGITWTPQTLPVSGNWFSITAGLAASQQTELTSRTDNTSVFSSHTTSVPGISNAGTPSAKPTTFTGSILITPNYGSINGGDQAEIVFADDVLLDILDIKDSLKPYNSLFWMPTGSVSTGNVFQINAFQQGAFQGLINSTVLHVNNSNPTASLLYNVSDTYHDLSIVLDSTVIAGTSNSDINIGSLGLKISNTLNVYTSIYYNGINYTAKFKYNMNGQTFTSKSTIISLPVTLRLVRTNIDIYSYVNSTLLGSIHGWDNRPAIPIINLDVSDISEPVSISARFRDFINNPVVLINNQFTTIKDIQESYILIQTPSSPIATDVSVFVHTLGFDRFTDNKFTYTPENRLVLAQAKSKSLILSSDTTL